MRQQGRGGSIISMASVAANAAGFAPPAYSVAKAGVINLTRVAAVDAPLCIRVNTISAGAVFGPLIERGFVRKLEREDEPQPAIAECGQPEDIAAIAAFLASPESRFITGAAIITDGGLTARGPSGLYSLVDQSSLGGLVGMDHGATGNPVAAQPHLIFANDFVMTRAQLCYDKQACYAHNAAVISLISLVAGSCRNWLAH